MLIHLHTVVTVKAELVASFKEAVRVFAEESRKETGNQRFEVFQSADNPVEFVIIEAYANAQALDAHHESDHYQTWSIATELIIESSESRSLHALA